MRSNPRRVQPKCANKPKPNSGQNAGQNLHRQCTEADPHSIAFALPAPATAPTATATATPSAASAATAAIAKCASHARAPRRDPKPAACVAKRRKKMLPKDGYLYSVASADAEAEAETETSVAAWIDFGSFG